MIPPVLLTSADSLAIVLVRPKEEGNVGAAARAMANTGFSRLLLVEPAPPLGATARAFAVGAGAILDRVERHPDLASALAPFRRVVATSSGRDRALAVPAVTARELPSRLAADPPGTPTALVFGPERSGLTADELALASLLVSIPCDGRSPRPVIIGRSFAKTRPGSASITAGIELISLCAVTIIPEML